MIETKIYCPFCSREMNRKENSSLHCVRGSMSLSGQMNREILNLVDECEFQEIEPTKENSKTDAHCPRCAKQMYADGADRFCAKCGLKMSADMIRHLREFHKHWGFHGIL